MKNMDKNRYFQIWSGKYTKTKVADIQRLCSKWVWLLMAVYKPSFADAEVFEYITKHFVRRHLSHDVAKMENAFVEVLRNEIAG